MKLSLRPATMKDAPFLLALRNDPQSLRWSWDHDPVTKEQHKNWLEKALFFKDPMVYIALAGRERVGTIRTKKTDEGDEISFTVVEKHRGKGYGTRMLQLLPKEEEISQVGYTDVDNLASQKAFLKAGFKLLVKAEKK